MAVKISDLDFKKMPAHLGVIMDGNGRWAKKKGLSRSEGHRAGSDALLNLMDNALKLQMKAVSVYAFSTENWKRPLEEVRSLFALLELFITSKLDAIDKKGIRIIHSGELKRIPKSATKKLLSAVEKTKNNKNLILNFCFNYGGRQEMLLAAEKVMKKRLANVLAKKNNPQAKDIIRIVEKKISAKEIENQLYTKGLPELDLLIRTAGEKRISNFLLWQSAYSEFWFTNKLWPDFNHLDLYKAVYDYQKRYRKFGAL